MKYFSGALIIALTLAVLVGAAVWPAVSDAPWEKSQQTKVVASPTPKLQTSPYTKANPQQSDAQRLATAQHKAQETLDSLKIEEKLGDSFLEEALRPSIVAYYLADTPEEQAQAMNQVAQTLLLWEAANRPQSGTSYVAPSGGTTDWRTDSDIRQLEYEIGRLRRCINYGGFC